VNVRNATPDDRSLLLQLVEEFEAGLPPLPYPGETPEEDWERLSARMRDGLVLIAEDDGNAVSFADAHFEPGYAFVHDVYVREEARRRGVGTALLAQIADEVRARGLKHIELRVETRNSEAIRFYERLGFAEGAKIMRVAVETLRTVKTEAGESVGAVHVQSDDPQAVERVVGEYLPRLKRGATATVEGGRGWTAVRLDSFDRDVLRKLGIELSYRFAVTVVLAAEEGSVVRFVIHDQGRMVDEYLSVPEYYGPLPPGDALALRANPTVVARLTGAEPARVRAVARTAETPGELPPALDLYAQIAELMGLQP